MINSYDHYYQPAACTARIVDCADQRVTASHAVLREHVYITLLREPTGCLTFKQFVDRLHAERHWKNVNPFDVRNALYELLREPGHRIEQRADGRYCRGVPTS
jgi:hypothetical protein